MAIGLKVKITGDKKLIRILSTEFPQRMRATLSAALYEGAQEAATLAKLVAPIKTGRLRQSIRAEVDNNELRAFLIAGNEQINYAEYQEFGTFTRRIDPSNTKLIIAALRNRAKTTGKGISPKLFLHRAANDSRARIIAIMNIKLNNLVNKLGLR